MTAADMAIAAAVLGAALWLLWRSVWRSKGGCAGCSGGACRSSQRDAAELVRIGQFRPPSADRDVRAAPGHE